jgi:prephenate dehydrogenase
MESKRFMLSNCTIGILGFGRFGGLMGRYLSQDFDVRVSSRSCPVDAIASIGAKLVDLPVACGCDVVIPSVPISVMEGMLKKISPLLKKDALVMDVCSVKEYPVQWMRKHLPESVSILGTHPMFGPDSAAESLQDRKIVLCKERIVDSLFEQVKSYLTGKGLVVIETSPEAHDRQIAVSLALTHFIGRSLAEFGAEPLEIDTEGYQRLLHTLGVVEHDTWQLFEDMNQYNPYSVEKRQAFIRAVERIDQKLNG